MRRRAAETNGEKRRTVEEIVRSEESYRAISEAVSDWAYALQVEPDGRPISLWTSPSIQRITGFTLAELTNSNGWLSLIHSDDRASLRAHLDALLTGKTDIKEYRIVTKSGEIRWLRDYTQPMWIRQSGAVHAVGGVRDITARRQAEVDRARLLSELDTTTEELERVGRSLAAELEEPVSSLAASLEGLEQDIATGQADRLAADVGQTRQCAERLKALLRRLQSDGGSERAGAAPQR